MKLLHFYLTVCHLSHRALSQPQQVVTVTVAAPIPSDEPEWRDSDRFTSAVLNSTNTYRSQHGAGDVVWNGTLADFADDYLDGGDCVFEHSGGPYGENLAMGYPNATASVEAWGDERDEYDFGRQGFSEETGHFTQLVWRNTTDVGCARRLCGRDGWYLAWLFARYKILDRSSNLDIATEQCTVNYFVLAVGVFKLHNASDEMDATNLETSLDKE